MRALLRPVSPSLARCELSHLPRRPIALDRARRQHDGYAQALAALGCELLWLPAEPDLPDAVFVEDTAVVLGEIAVIARPGAESRRRETASTAAALARWRELVRIEPPGTLDGGDVLQAGRTLYIGATRRSNAAGIAQLATAVAAYGYRVEALPVAGCLHLKSAATMVDDETILHNPRWIDPARFRGLNPLAVDPDEPHAANALRVAGSILYPASCPRTADSLERRGFRLRRLDMSETEKAEGGVTCCSILFR